MVQPETDSDDRKWVKSRHLDLLGKLGILTLMRVLVWIMGSSTVFWGSGSLAVPPEVRSEHRK